LGPLSNLDVGLPGQGLQFSQLVRALSYLSGLQLLLEDVILVLPEEFEEEVARAKGLRFKHAIQKSLIVLSTLLQLRRTVLLSMLDMRDAWDQGLGVLLD
jgi:hypothetical protein